MGDGMGDAEVHWNEVRVSCRHMAVQLLMRPNVWESGERRAARVVPPFGDTTAYAADAQESGERGAACTCHAGVWRHICSRGRCMREWGAQGGMCRATIWGHNCPCGRRMGEWGAQGGACRAAIWGHNRLRGRCAGEW